MKKSRIIVPALAMLTLSVAASVTGTVAWFTASRTANMSLSSLAALNTSGDLSLELVAGNQSGVPGASGNVKTLELQPMRDASYDVSHTDKTSNATHVYYGLLNNEGNKVTQTVAVSSPDLKFGNFGGQNVYFANYFTGTFTTQAVNASYLYFNNNKTKSYVEGYTTLASNNIYRALRVSMEATSIKGVNPSATTEETKTIVWAPYTNETTVYNLCKAGTLSTPVNASGDKVNITSSYKEGETALAKETASEAIKVVKVKDNDPVDTSTRGTEALKDPCLLSSKLVYNAESSLEVKVVVKFTIWFEGLDPVCVNGAAELNTFTTATKKALNMSFYAIDSTLFAA